MMPQKHKLFISAFSSDNEVDVKEKELIRSIVDKLTGMGIEVQLGSNPVYDADALNKLNDSDYVLLVEGIGKSAYIDIDKKLHCINSFNIHVIGCVVV